MRDSVKHEEESIHIYIITSCSKDSEYEWQYSHNAESKRRTAEVSRNVSTSLTFVQNDKIHTLITNRR